MFRKKDQPSIRRKPLSDRNQSIRRNRTETSTAKDDIRRRRAERHGRSEKLELKSKSTWRMLPSFIALTVIVLSGMYMLYLDVNSGRVRIADMSDITSVQQLENLVADEATYQEAFSELLGSSVLNRTKLTIRSNFITADFMEAHPEVAQAELRHGVVDNTPILFVVLREPHVIVSAEDSDSVYIIDVNGVAFARLPRGEILDDVPYIEDSVSAEIELGQQVLPIDTIHFIDAVLYQLNTAEHAVDTLALPAIANELHVQITGDEFVGKFDITGNPRLQAGSFIATRSQLLEENDTPDEYIDVRVSGRSYYR